MIKKNNLCKLNKIYINLLKQRFKKAKKKKISPLDYRIQKKNLARFLTVYNKKNIFYNK